MAGTTRLELATSAVTGQRSNQLNYVPAMLRATGGGGFESVPSGASRSSPLYHGRGKLITAHQSGHEGGGSVGWTKRLQFVRICSYSLNQGRCGQLSCAFKSHAASSGGNIQARSGLRTQYLRGDTTGFRG